MTYKELLELPVGSVVEFPEFFTEDEDGDQFFLILGKEAYFEKSKYCGPGPGFFYIPLKQIQTNKLFAAEKADFKYPSGKENLTLEPLKDYHINSVKKANT